MIPVPVFFITYIFMLCLILFYKLFGEKTNLLVVYIDFFEWDKNCKY